jgi:hypothetical protein
LLALLTLGCLGLSAATRLTVNPGRVPYVGSDGRCASQAVEVDVVGTTATVMGIDNSACGGLTLQLYTQGDGTTVTNTGTISGASIVFTLAQAIDIDAAMVTIDTWGVPTSWTQAASSEPVLPCAPGAGSGTC